jgi:hypothetical protein
MSQPTVPQIGNPLGKIARGSARRARRAVVKDSLALADSKCGSEIQSHPRKFRDRYLREWAREYNRKHHLSVGASQKKHITKAIEMLKAGATRRAIERACIEGLDRMNRYKRSCKRRAFWAAVHAREKKSASVSKIKK